jgi:hypothetical protein
MDTMSVDVAADRPAGSLAVARDSALRHGGGTCTLGLASRSDGIEVAVRDHSPHAPRLRTPDPTVGTGGLGRPLVNRLATATAVTRRASGGKTVSALLPR